MIDIPVHTFFQNIEGLKILIVGDVMLDRYLTGTVSRISPEAPVPVVAQVQSENRLGGAANVALNIQSLGATPILAGYIGQDEDTELFFELMEDNGLNDIGITSSAARLTTVKTRIIAEHQHLLRLDKEVTSDLNEEEEKEFIRKLDKLFADFDFDAVVLQDYNKGVCTKGVIKAVIQKAKNKAIPVCVDPKLNNFWMYKEVDLFKPNLREIQDALKKKISPTLSHLNKAASDLSEKLNNKNTLITLSENGVFGAQGNLGFILPTQSRKVADVCGAGDAVISIAAVGMAMELDLMVIAELANLVGGQVVEKLGVVPVDKVQLKKEMLEHLVKP